MRLALFDFDGTVTREDSLSDFIQYTVGKSAYYRGLLSLSLTLVAYKLKLIPNYVAKEKVIAHFFRGWDEKKFQDIADHYSIEQIDKIARPQAIKKICWHKDRGDRVVIVSASMECWLAKWCAVNKLDLIATRLEVSDGKLTGKFATRNCYGREKVRRIIARYDLSEFSEIYAYGDSRGDREMFKIATQQYYNMFR